MSDALDHLLNRVLVRTPGEASSGAVTREQGGLDGMDYANNNDTGNYETDMNMTEAFEGTARNEATRVDLSGRPASTTSVRSLLETGTSLPVVNRNVSQVLFVNTKAVVDLEEALPSSNRNSTSTSTTSSSRVELLSARTSTYTAPSVTWVDASWGSSKFGVYTIPKDVAEFSLLCRKKLGNGTRMCIKKGCTINHRGREIAYVNHGEVYVQKSPDQIFLEPKTNGSNVTSEVLSAWMSARKKIDDWSTAFAVANSIQYHEVLSSDDLEHGFAFIDQARIHKSPGFLRFNRNEEAPNTFAQLLASLNSPRVRGDFDLDSKKLILNEDDLDENQSKGSRRKLSDDLSQNSESIKETKVKDCIDHIYKLFVFLTEALDEKDFAISEEVKILFSRIEMVQTDLGSRSTTRSDKWQVPTIWGSIASLAGAIDDIQQEIDVVPTTEVMKSFLVSEFDRIEAAARETVNLIIIDVEGRVAMTLAQKESALKENQKEIQRLTSEVRLAQRAQGATDGILLRLAEGSSVLKDEIQDVRREVRLAKFSAGSTSQVGGNCSNYVPIPTYDLRALYVDTELAALKNELSLAKFSAGSTSQVGGNCSNYVPIPTYDLRALYVDTELAALKNQVSKIVSDTDKDAIKSFGLGFINSAASDAWLDTNILDTAAFGLIVDAHLVFEHLNHRVYESESSLKTLHVMLKLELSNMTQGICIQSYETRIPKFLSKSSIAPSGSRAKSGLSNFDRVSTYEDWEDPNIGIKELIKNELITFESAHLEFIADSTDPYSQGRLIATQALEASISWIKDFIIFIDDIYKSCMLQRTFTAARAWELTTQLGRRVCFEVSQPRTHVTTTLRIGNNAKINKLTFWPTLRSHDIMKEYKDANFKNHPTISSEYIKFLAANSGSEIIQNLDSKVTLLKEEATNAMKSAKESALLIGKAMNAIDELKKKNFDIEKKLAKLESNDPILDPPFVHREARSVGLKMKEKIVHLTAMNSTSLNQGAKRLEIGLIKTRQPLTVYLLSETFPVWLFVLEVTWCIELIVVGHTSMEQFLVLFTKGEQEMLSTLLFPFIKLKVLSFCCKEALDEQTTPRDSTILLISGSLFSYVLPLLVAYHDFKACGVVDSHFVGRLRNGKPTSQDPLGIKRLESLKGTTFWQRCRHEATGGATNYVALFAFANLEVTHHTSMLQRGIRHLFNASIKPGPPPKVLPEHRSGHYYAMDDRLVPGFYNLPVLCPSHFHSSGTGYRILTIEELGTAHGFPRHLMLLSFPRSLLSFPPCQLLLASIEPIWKTSPRIVCDLHPPHLKRATELETWFPAISRSLPHAWIDESLITATASKADDAASPCRLWDARLELLFPGCTPHLATIRTYVLRWQRRRLFVEIKAYLVKTFGLHWASHLCLKLRSTRVGPLTGLLGGKITIDTSRKPFSIGSSMDVESGKRHNRDKNFAIVGKDTTAVAKDNRDKTFVIVGKDTTAVAKDMNRLSSILRDDTQFSTAYENNAQGLNQTTSSVQTTCNSGDITPVINNLCRLHQGTRQNTENDCAVLHSENPKSEVHNDVQQEVMSDVKAERLLLEVDRIREVLSKLCNSSWWEWDVGSSLLFWRWGEDARLALHGMVPFIIAELPHNVKKSRSLDKNMNIEKIIEKLSTIVKRGYIQTGHVKSLIDFFAVPKGDDIRLVYNGTSCGLNGATWAPNFWLPYPRTAIRLLDYGFYSVDVDLGEMFLNFPLHESIQAFSGIDLSPFQKELGIGNGDKKVWYRWKRNWMGARMSPYSSVQFCSLAEEFCRGNHKDALNPLRWDEIILNLPGSPGFDPSKPRVYKWCRIMVSMSGELVIFVDDVRVTALTVELAWAIARQVCSRFQYLGLQDATRKRKPPTQSPGAWAGAVFATTEDTVTKTVTLEKWNKAKRIISTLNSKIHDGGLETTLLYKELEVSRGFLCHLSMTYEVLVPFLKGFHLILAKHLSKRDKEGWKMTDKIWASYLAEKRHQHEVEEEQLQETFDAEEDSSSMSNPPKFVKVTEHLINDLIALAAFTETDSPPIINDRCSSVRIVRYGFGDASGTGFGSTIQTRQGLKYRVGVWGSDEDSESSNFKELENVVSTIEDEAQSGGLKESALFFFTDNTTVESALFKGNSTSRKLFNLVVRFRKIQLLYGMQVSVSHVSGKRMIDQGTDGFSRGNMREGVGSGIEMIQFIPLHLGAIERHPPLLDWIKAWAGQTVEYLSPSDWYTRGHDHSGGKIDKAGFWRISTTPGIFLWGPAPAAAEIAIEQLRRALIKRQRSTHIVICPRLLTTEWLKQLHKTADLIVYLPAGVDNEAWPAAMFEPLTIAFVFPFLSCEPWKRKGSPQMLHLARTLPSMWKDGQVDSRNLLRQFFSKQLQLTRMSERLVRKVLYFKQ